MSSIPLLLIPWRATLLWLQSIAPWGAPLEAKLSADPRSYAAAGLIFFALLAAWIVRRVETVGRRDPVAALLALSAIVSLVASAALPRGSWPLSLGALVLAPFVWATLLVAIRKASAASRAPTFFVVCVALISWTLGAKRLTDRERVWTEIAASNDRWPIAARALLSLARARHAAPRELDALAERCHSADAADLECAALVADARAREGDCVRALDAAQSALAASPSAALLGTVGRCIDALRKGDDASAALMRRAVVANPNDQALRRALATMQERRGERDAALATLRAGPTLTDGEAIITLARLSIERGDDAGARAALDGLLAREPAHVEGRFTRGWIEHRAGHFNAARDNYLRALQADPTHFSARFNLARMLLSAGVTAEALHHAQRLLEQNARDPRVRQLARDIQSQVAQSESPDAGR